MALSHVVLAEVGVVSEPNLRCVEVCPYGCVYPECVGVRPLGAHEVNVSVGEINIIAPEVNALKRLDAWEPSSEPPDSAAAGAPDAAERSVAG